MNKTTKSEGFDIIKITATTESLMRYLDCGRKTAVQIGEEAGARLQYGKRVLWCLDKIRDYVSKEAV